MRPSAYRNHVSRERGQLRNPIWRIAVKLGADG